MTGFPTGTEAVLSPSVRDAWATVRGLLPSGAYLARGTAIALRLQHRTSEDLDFFTSAPLDVEELYDALVESIDTFVTVRVTPKAGNLAVIVGSTKVEFSDASSNPLTEPTERIAGVEVAGLGDLLAMKLSAITKRKQLRDYEDLRAIEQIAGRRAEEGLALAARRYRLRDTASLVVFETALGRVGECGPDPLVMTPREELVSYWVRRAAEVVAGSSRWDVPVLDDDQAEALFGPVADVPEDLGECDQVLADAAKRLPLVARQPSAPVGSKACGAWMPVARSRCKLPVGHNGHHRS